MALTDKDILITPNDGSSTADPKQEFTGASSSASDTITLETQFDGSITTLSFDGSEGQLFSISNDLTGTIFAVNDSAGIPSLEIDNDGEVRIAEFSGNVGIGLTAPADKLHVKGTRIRLDGTQYELRTSAGVFRAAFKDDGGQTTLFADGNGSQPYITLNGSDVIIGDGTSGQAKALQLFVGSAAVTTDNTGLTFTMDGTYSDGRYEHRFRKRDEGGGIPLYIDKTEATANSHTAIARFGSYTNNADQFEVYGGMKASGNLTVTGVANITGGVTCSTVNTGQGATEVHLMNQNVRTTDGVTFATVNTGQGANELYAMNQNVRSSDSPTFQDLTVQGDLTITGDLNTVSVTDLDVTDKTITLGVGQGEANSGGSGIIISGSGASLLWDEADNYWAFNKKIAFDTTPTTTNQALGIRWTGFDKEGTTDFSDVAEIIHTTNTGGHSGSVLLIKSQNDSNDGIAFNTNTSSFLYRNSNKIWDAANDGSGSGLDADTLDGINSGSFLRSDANDTASGTITFSANTLIAEQKFIGYSSTYNYKPRVTGGIGTRSEIIGAANILIHGDTDGSGTGEFVSIRAGAGTANELKIVSKTSSASQSSSALIFNGGQVWHAGNDGSGSGLDADTLDGINSGSFVRSDAADTLTGTLTMNVGGNAITISSGAPQIRFNDTNHYDHWIHVNSNRFYVLSDRNGDGTWETPYPLELNSGNNEPLIFGNKAWTAGNDGSGSGLDADLLDGNDSTAFLRRNTSDTVPTYTNKIQFYSNTNMATASASQASLEAFSNGSGNDAFMAFHVGGDFACYLGLDGGTNKLSVGGWSMGANSYPIYHEGNKPTFAELGINSTNINALGINATTVDGIDSASFLRSDTADTATGQLFFDGGFDAHPIMLSGTVNFNNVDRSGFYNLYNINSGSTGYAGFPYGTMIAIGNDKASQGFGLQIAHERTNTQFKVRGMNDTGSTWSSWATIWTSAIDGSGSGLDADILDGVHASQFLRSDADDVATGLIEFTGKVEAHQFQIDRNAANAAIWFQEGSLDQNHVLWNDYYGGPTTRGGAGSGFDGIKWNTYRGIHIRTGLQGAYNSIIVENSSGSTNNHTVKLYASNVKRFETTTTGISVNGNISVGDLAVISQSSGAVIVGDVDGNDDIESVDVRAFGGNGRVYIGDAEIFFNGTSNSNAGFKMIGNTGAFHANNDVIAYSSTLTASDVRLKENVRPIESSLSKILTLDGVKFDWKDKDKPNNQLGFIAQDVEKVLPEVVNEIENGLGGYDGHKVVNYSAVVPVLVEAIKEQQKLINRLEDRLKDLEDKNGEN